MLAQSAYLFTAKVIGYGMRILLPMFLVRVLTKADFGAYSQFFLLEIITKTLFQFGAAQSLYYFVPRNPRNAGSYLINSIMLSFVFLAGGFLLISFFRTDIAAASGLRVIDDFFGELAVYTTVMMILMALEAYMTARGWIRETAIWDVARQAAATVATLGAAVVYRDLAHVILALVIVRIVSMFAMMAHIHWWKRGFASERYFLDLRDQVRYGVVLGVTGMLLTLSMRIHELVVNRYYDIETYAVYAAGLRQIPILQFFGQAVASVALGRFSELEKAGDWAGIRQLWDRILGSMYGVGLPVTILFLLVAEPLIVLMFTADYAEAVPIFRWNTIAMLSLLLNSTLVLRAMDRNDVSLKVNAATLVTLPFLLYGGMRAWGLEGVVAINALVLIGGRVVTHFLLNRVAGAYLPYVSPLASVRAFYVGSWAAARTRIRELAARRA